VEALLRFIMARASWVAQIKKRADRLAKRFCNNIPKLLKSYEWAENIRITVSVYGEYREHEHEF
jgi:hypothetical protein